MTAFAERQVDFVEVRRFAWSWALVRADVRFDYPEPRLSALAPIADRLHALIYTVEHRGVRVISLRKANRNAMERYEADVDPAD